jgi:hypothetical protein
MDRGTLGLRSSPKLVQVDSLWSQEEEEGGGGGRRREGGREGGERRHCWQQPVARHKCSSVWATPVPPPSSLFENSSLAPHCGPCAVSAIVAAPPVLVSILARPNVNGRTRQTAGPRLNERLIDAAAATDAAGAVGAAAGAAVDLISPPPPPLVLKSISFFSVHF